MKVLVLLALNRTMKWESDVYVKGPGVFFSHKVGTYSPIAVQYGARRACGQAR